jgi:hypothetical protein
MRKKGGNLLEEHVEKIMLVLVGLVCIWLLITRVVISPNKVLLYAGVELGPGEIDRRISREAEVLKSKLDSTPELLPPYQPRVDAFVDMINLPIADIDTSLHFCLPIHSSAEILEKRRYSIPWIGEIEGTAIEYLRTVAYVPIVEIDEENPYEMMICQPNDIDFVTVEGKFDIAGLYGRFYDSFAGDDVEEEQWRDPCLALPVFAAVQLQRQELDADGNWSQWQIVPRTKIDPRKNMFESVEEVEDLPPGGIKVRLLQFDDPQVRRDLLQPEAYKIASAKEEWFPPLLHKKYVEQQKEIEEEKGRREKELEMLEREQEEEKRREEREKSREDRRDRGTDTRSGVGSRGRYDDTTRRDDRSGGRRTRDRRTRTEGTDAYGYGESDATSARRREREERAREREERLAEMRAQTQRTSIDDIYIELDQMLITERTDFTRLREPLTFWAHDDTVEGGKNYRYRIRLGVFNPVVGTNSFKEEDEDLKNKIILWSEFSDVEKIVKVPEKLYFFPRDVKDTARIVTVDVARYKLGYWYIKDFAVKPGEDIGKVADFQPVVVENRRTVMPVAPQTIDYSTGAVLVDLVPVNDWSGGRNMYPRQYYRMLYSLDGVGIEHVPVSTRYWDEDLRNKLNEIRQLQKESREPFRAWDTRLSDMELAPDLEYGYDERLGTTDEGRRTSRRSRRDY